MSRKRHNKSKRDVPKEAPYQLPLPPQKLGKLQTASIVAQHLVPLAYLLLGGGSVAQFLLLCVFSIAFSVASLVVIGLAVSTQPLRVNTNATDKILSWVFLLGVGGVISGVVTAISGVIFAVVLVHEQEFWSPTLGLSVLAIVVSSTPGLYARYRDELRLGLPEADRQRRDQPQIVLNLIFGLQIYLLSSFLIQIGRFGLIAMALLITAFFIFRDLRPDLIRRLAPPSHRLR